MNKRLVRIGAGLAASTAGIAGLSIVGATPAQASAGCQLSASSTTLKAVCTGTTYASSVRISWKCTFFSFESWRSVDRYVGQGTKTFYLSHGCGKVPGAYGYSQTAP